MIEKKSFVGSDMTTKVRLKNDPYLFSAAGTGLLNFEQLRIKNGQ